MSINPQTLEQYLSTRDDFEHINGSTYTIGGDSMDRVLMLYGDSRTTALIFIVRGNELIPAQIVDGEVSMVIR